MDLWARRGGKGSESTQSQRRDFTCHPKASGAVKEASKCFSQKNRQNVLWFAQMPSEGPL